MPLPLKTVSQVFKTGCDEDFLWQTALRIYFRSVKYAPGHETKRKMQETSVGYAMFAFDIFGEGVQKKRSSKFSDVEGGHCVNIRNPCGGFSFSTVCVQSPHALTGIISPQIQPVSYSLDMGVSRKAPESVAIEENPNLRYPYAPIPSANGFGMGEMGT